MNYFTILPDDGACDGVPLSADHLAYERSLAADLRQDTTTAANATGVTLVDLASASPQRSSGTADGTLRALGKCLDVNQGATAGGTLVQLWDCNGTNAQHWSLS